MTFVRGIIWIVVALLIAGALVAASKPVYAVVWLGVCLVATSLFHFYHLQALNRWSMLPRQRQLPMGIGGWRTVLDRLGRFTRQEAEEREEAALELERLHAAVNLLPDALVVMDRYNLVQWFNRAAEELHGIVGMRRPIDHFIRQPEFTRYLESKDFRAPLQLSLPGRPGRTFLLRLVPTPDSWRLLITRDVTEQNKLDAMRRDFVANVSHEIRTPLTVVNGYIETLIDLDLPREEMLTHLHAARKQAVTMQRLLEDLLTLSSLENAGNHPQDQEFELEPLLRALHADARTLSAGRHRIDLLIDQPVRLRGVPAEIESAVRNLLTNAIRYTPQGGRITMSWIRRAQAGHLTVEDTGIGIAPEHLPRLTERFYRVDRGRSRETGGTGLGLAIVKHIAQRHDATLAYDSTLGKGTRFSLVIPRDRV
ncbi:MAG TPA: phosphate regulon sensor histidine kinase PhoR, partial [Lautropia sp.]|nr:phosphate regulon sensor histidine kinase PhoR [Lautropia sp.]